MRFLSLKYLILIDKTDLQEFGCGFRRMPMELRTRGVAVSAQAAAHPRPGRAGVGERGASRLQAGIPQEHVNWKRMTMKRMIEGTPKAM